MRKTLILVLVLAAVAAGVFFLLKKPAAPAGDSAGGDDAFNPNAVVPVKVGNLSVATVHSYLDVYGTVSAAPAAKGRPAALARISVPQSGLVKKVYVAEGDEVRAGEPLFDLDDRAATAAVTKAGKAAAAAEAELKRQQELLQSENTSAKAVQDAQGAAASAESDVAAAAAQLKGVHVVAPIAGTVTKLTARDGEIADPATPSAEIADLHRLIVSADIPAEDAAKVAVGNTAEVQTDPPTKADVSYLARAVDPAANTVNVRLTLPDDSGLRLGQYVQARIVTAVHKNVLVAPAESVITTQEEGKTVISVVTGDQAVQKEVQTGIREGSVIEVDGDGLKAGDKIVTVGAYGLPEKVKIKIEK